MLFSEQGLNNIHGFSTTAILNVVLEKGIGKQNRQDKGKLAKEGYLYRMIKIREANYTEKKTRRRNLYNGRSRASMEGM